MTRIMKRRAAKIIFLVALITICFFPFLAVAGTSLADEIREDLKVRLEGKGLEVVSVSEAPVLLPDEGISFEIRDISRLHPGRNRLIVDLFYNGVPYVKAGFDLEISGGTEMPVKSTRIRMTNSGTAWTVRRGDKVTLLLRKESLEIRVDGKALENGRKNDRITALNLFQNTTVHGQVIDRQRILIEE
jgi:hypothetical protein